MHFTAMPQKIYLDTQSNVEFPLPMRILPDSITTSCAIAPMSPLLDVEMDIIKFMIE